MDGADYPFSGATTLFSSPPSPLVRRPLATTDILTGELALFPSHLRLIHTRAVSSIRRARLRAWAGWRTQERRGATCDLVSIEAGKAHLGRDGVTRSKGDHERSRWSAAFLLRAPRNNELTALAHRFWSRSRHFRHELGHGVRGPVPGSAARQAHRDAEEQALLQGPRQRGLEERDRLRKSRSPLRWLGMCHRRGEQARSVVERCARVGAGADGEKFDDSIELATTFGTQCTLERSPELSLGAIRA